MTQLAKTPDDLQTLDSLSIEERRHQDFFARQAAKESARRRLKTWDIARKTAAEIATSTQSPK